MKAHVVFVSGIGFGQTMALFGIILGIPPVTSADETNNEMMGEGGDV